MKTAGIFFQSTLFYGVFILFLCLFTNLYSGGFGYDKRCANCGLLSVTHVRGSGDVEFCAATSTPID